MLVWVLCVDIGVIIFEVILASVIWRIDIDYVDLARVGVIQDRQGMIIIAFDY